MASVSLSCGRMFVAIDLMLRPKEFFGPRKSVLGLTVCGSGNTIACTIEAVGFVAAALEGPGGL